MSRIGGIIDFLTGGRNPNRKDAENEDSVQGIVNDKMPELTIDLKNEELIKLTRKWEREWTNSDVYQNWKEGSKVSRNYWKGKQYDPDSVGQARPNVDNVLFESLETEIPMATKKNAEPMSELAIGVEETEENKAYAKMVGKKLWENAEETNLQTKLKM